MYVFLSLQKKLSEANFIYVDHILKEILLSSE